MPKITGLYAGISGIYAVVLALMTIRQRRKLRISLGDGTREYLLDVLKVGQPKKKFEETNYWALNTCLRAHGNFVENAPFVLGLIGYAEMNGLEAVYVHGLLGSYLVGRLWYTLTFYYNKIAVGVGRPFGMTTTFVPMLVGGVYAIRSFLGK